MFFFKLPDKFIFERSFSFTALFLALRSLKVFGAVQKYLGKAEENEKERNPISDKKQVGFCALPHSGDTVPDFHH